MGAVLVNSRTTKDAIRGDATRTDAIVADRGRCCLAAMLVMLLATFSTANAHAQGFGGQRIGNTDHRQQILESLPLDRLTMEARNRILAVAEKPTLFRQLPSQAIACDRDMFLFLTRNPDVLVGLWDLMGITQVQSRRTGPFQLEASDGAGTLCNVDLVYGDDRQHIFVVDGSYDGRMVPTLIRGKGVFVLNSTYATGSDGQTTVSGTLDCFVQLESLGIDLIARTLSPIIGRSADSNFSQTAHFISQVSQTSAHNPSAMLDIASRLPQVDPPIRKSFADAIVTVARRNISLRAQTNPTQQTQANVDAVHR